MRHKTEDIIRPVYNLNEMAHDATIKLIRQVIDSKVNLEEVSWVLYFIKAQMLIRYIDLRRPCWTFQFIQIKASITFSWYCHHS
jgi:hypothetical protein